MVKVPLRFRGSFSASSRGSSSNVHSQQQQQQQQQPQDPQPHLHSRDDVCSICLDRLTSRKRHVGAVLPCRHCFHLKCYNRWHATQLLRNCDKFGSNSNNADHVVRCPLCQGQVSHFLPHPRIFAAPDDVFAEAVLHLLFKTTAAEHADFLQKLLQSLPNDANLAVNQKAMIHGASVLPATVAVMRQFANDAPLQSIACRLLLQLFFVNGRGFADFYDAGGLEAVVAALERFPDSTVIQFRGIGTLNNITFHPSCRDLLVAENSNGSTSDNNPIANLLCAALLAMENCPDNARIQEWSCCILLRFASMSPQLKQDLIRLGPHALIGTVIDRHASQPALQNLARSLLIVLIGEPVDVPRNVVPGEEDNLLAASVEEGAVPRLEMK